MSSSIVHVDLELNESVDVGDQAGPVVVEPEDVGKPMEGDVPQGVDQDVEMLEVVKPKEADALPVVGPGVVGDDQSEENLVEEVLQVEKTQQGNAPPDVNPVEEVLEVECLDVEMLEVVGLPKEHGDNPEVNLEDEVLEVEKS